MRKKDKQLFNKSIHEVKQVIAEIVEEKKQYKKDTNTMRRNHDRAVKKYVKELLEVVDELYELYSDLTDEKGR